MRSFLLGVVLVATCCAFSLRDIHNFKEVKEVDQGLICDVCEFVGDEVVKRVLTPGNKEQVINMAEFICDSLPLFAKECHSAVEEYGNDLLDKLFKLFDVQKICSMAHLCQSKNELPSFFGLQDKEGCKACMDGLGIVKMIIDSDEIEDLLDIAVTEICLSAGGDTKTCTDLSVTIVNQIVSNLRPMFSPDAICKSAGACPGAHLETVQMKDTGCTLCKDSMMIIKKLLKSPEVSEIMDVAVNETCIAIGLGVETCEKLVGSIFHDILDNLMIAFEPEFVCGRMGACHARAAVSAVSADSEGCTACIDALDIVEQILKSPATLDLIHIAVNETCMAIGGQVETCEAIVNGILDPIITNVVTLFKPRSLCTSAGACAAKAQLGVAKPNKMACLACEDSLTIVKHVLESEELAELMHLGINATCGEYQQCRMILSVIVDNTRHQLLPKFQPYDICTVAGTCPPHKLQAEGLFAPPAYCCDFCVNAINLFKNVAGSKEAAAMFADTVEGTCETIPIPFCKVVLNAMVKEILTEAQQLDTQGICNDMGACDGNFGAYLAWFS